MVGNAQTNTFARPRATVVHENVRALPYYHFVESEDIAREGHDSEAYRNVELISITVSKSPDAIAAGLLIPFRIEMSFTI